MTNAKFVTLKLKFEIFNLLVYFFVSFLVVITVFNVLGHHIDRGTRVQYMCDDDWFCMFQVNDSD